MPLNAMSVSVVLSSWYEEWHRPGSLLIFMDDYKTNWSVTTNYLRLGRDALKDDAVLKENVIRRKRSGPSCSGWGKVNAEAAGRNRHGRERLQLRCYRYIKNRPENDKWCGESESSCTWNTGVDIPAWLSWCETGEGKVVPREIRDQHTNESSKDRRGS